MFGSERSASTHAHVHAPISRRGTGGFGRLMRPQRGPPPSESSSSIFAFSMLPCSQTVIGVLILAACMLRLPLCQARACPYARVETRACFFVVAFFGYLTAPGLVSIFSRRGPPGRRDQGMERTRVWSKRLCFLFHVAAGGLGFRTGMRLMLTQVSPDAIRMRCEKGPPYL